MICMDSIWMDLRLAVRSLRKDLSFTLVSVTTLALGIGATTALFTVLHSVLLNPLPYPQADRLAVLWNELGQGGAQSLPAVSAADFRDYQVLSESFEEFAAASGANVVGLSGILTGDGVPEKVDLSPVTANFFSLFGVDPALGRHFTAEEEAFQGPKVALISHELWQSRFGSDPSLLNQTIEIDGLTHQVVGILPQGFRLLLPAEAFLLKHSDIWTPLQVDYGNLPPRNFTSFSVFGRLRPGATFAQAQEEMDRIAAHLRATYPVHTGSNLQIRAVPLQQDVVKGVRPALVALMGAVGFVLLIVCANIANLLLVRGAGRRQEMAIQAALGANTGRLLRRLLMESALLAAAGGILAVAVAKAGLAALRALRPDNLPRLEEIGLDGTALVFTIGVAVLTVLLFGFLPALQGARPRAAMMLRAGARSSGGRSQNRVRQLLVMGEIGLSFVLLLAVGLMIQSFAALQQVRPGFDAEGVLTFRVELPRAEYGELERRTAFFEALEDGLRTLPGVDAVGRISKLPLSGSGSLQPYAYNEETARLWESVTADGRWVTPGYFAAMGTRLLSGRTFTAADRQRDASAPAIIIDEVVARRAFPDQNPVGQFLQVEPNSSENPFAEVIGVVEHTRAHDLSRDLWGQIYRHGWAGNRMTVVVHTAADPAQLVPSLRSLLRQLDMGLPVIDPQPMAAVLREATAHSRFSLLLMGIFGALALVLVALGIYGVISHSVGQRGREFAIRLALGEIPWRLTRRVLGQGFVLAALAMALGVTVSLALGRYLTELLYEVDPADPGTMAAAGALLAGIALLASYLPARRASRVAPASLLREE